MRNGGRDGDDWRVVGKRRGQLYIEVECGGVDAARNFVRLSRKRERVLVWCVWTTGEAVQRRTLSRTSSRVYAQSLSNDDICRECE